MDDILVDIKDLTCPYCSNKLNIMKKIPPYGRYAFCSTCKRVITITKTDI